MPAKTAKADRKHFTDTQIQKWLDATPKGAKRVEYVDDERPYIRVRISHDLAVFYWIGHDRHHGGTKRHHLGEFPRLRTEAARKKANDVRNQVQDGKDPSKEKRAVRAKAEAGKMTIADMRDAYIARRIRDGKPLAPSTLVTYNNVLPRLLGDYMERPISALDSDTLMELVAKMGKKRTALTKYGREVKRGNTAGSTLAVKALARLCKVHKVTDDPTKEPREEKRLPQIGARDGRLGTDEAQALFAWLNVYSNDAATAPYKARAARMLMVAIVTGWRIGTVEAWQWEEIDFDAMTTKLPKNKRGYKQTLPLWPVLADVFPKSMRKKTGPVFDGPWTDELSLELPWQVSPHDARKAAAALLLDMTNEGKVHSLTVELLMTHFQSVTVKNYLRTTPIPNQLRNLRPAVNRVSEFYAAKLGHKATVKALEASAAQRREEAKENNRERRSVYWVDVAARRKAKRAALAA